MAPGETSPDAQTQAMQHHWGMMPDAYQQQMGERMQTMRGMGWMWAPNAAASLPDADSKGAKLESKYCSQCHAPPPPSLHSAKEWSAVTSRMKAHIGDKAHAAGAGAELKVPSAAELDAIGEYLGKHAR